MRSTKVVAQTFSTAGYQEMTSQLWTYRQAIKDDIVRRYPDAKLVDTLDGAFGFILDLPARSITGLISSPAELRRRREVGFWRSASEDGFNIVPNCCYLSLETEKRNFEVLDEFRPPASPVSFYRIKSID